MTAERRHREHLKFVQKSAASCRLIGDESFKKVFYGSRNKYRSIESEATQFQERSVAHTLSRVVFAVLARRRRALSPFSNAQRGEPATRRCVSHPTRLRVVLDLVAALARASRRHHRATPARLGLDFLHLPRRRKRNSAASAPAIGRRRGGGFVPRRVGALPAPTRSSSDRVRRRVDSRASLAPRRRAHFARALVRVFRSSLFSLAPLFANL